MDWSGSSRNDGTVLIRFQFETEYCSCFDFGAQIKPGITYNIMVDLHMRKVLVSFILKYQLIEFNIK